MADVTSRRWVPVLAGLLGLAALVGLSAPAMAGDVTDCGNFSTSTDTRFDLKNNISFAGTTGTCLIFPGNAVVYLNGFIVRGTGLDQNTAGIVAGDNAFIWGPGIVKEFGTCIVGGNATAVEGLLTNSCSTGIILRSGYKVKEVRVHDCTPSNFSGIGILLSQGGFVESSIVRACDFGVITGRNNKIWNLIVTRHLFTGLIVGAGNAVSRTVISHPRSTASVGLDYSRCGGAGAGCEDASNSVSGHTTPLNIVIGGARVVTQPHEQATTGATNCDGAPIGRTILAPAGLIAGDC